MSGKRQSKSRTKSSVQRFPRLPEGALTANLVNYLWTRLRFDVRETDDYTEFVFRLPFTKKLKDNFPGWHSVLIGQGALRLRKAALDAYRTQTRGDKLVKKDLNNALFQIFVKAIEQLLSEARKLGPEYETFVESNVKQLLDKGPRKRGPQRRLLVEHRRAVRFARKHEYIHRYVRTFQKQAKSIELRRRSFHKAFCEQVRERLPYTELCCAFEKEGYPINSNESLVAAFQKLTYPKHFSLQVQIELINGESTGAAPPSRILEKIIGEGKKLLKQDAPIL